MRLELANGQVVDTDVFEVAIIFDDEAKRVLTLFTDSADSLIGTQLLAQKRLAINFVTGEVIIEQA